ncbi:MAG: FliM/FliN family flagellar motor switch protein [Actinobacteria bacterium]|nr:FliM/FliN family flagellar motor switch protein [Actinomycetota bacterium]
MLETPTPAPAQFTAFGEGAPPAPTASLDVIAAVQLEIVIALGRTRMTVQQLLQLRNGSVIEIGQAGGLVEVHANGSLVAHGEVVVVGDDLGVRIVDIPQQRIQ